MGFVLCRGPLGTIFREDCAEDVEVRPTEAEHGEAADRSMCKYVQCGVPEVFGTGQMLPEECARHSIWLLGLQMPCNTKVCSLAAGCRDSELQR